MRYQLTTADGKEWLAIPQPYQCQGFKADEWYWHATLLCRVDLRAGHETPPMQLGIYECEPKKREHDAAIQSARDHLEILGFRPIEKGADENER